LRSKQRAAKKVDVDSDDDQRWWADEWMLKVGKMNVGRILINIRN
jgi:hypothetical protein